MINICNRWPPKHSQVLKVIEYLNENHPIEDSNIEFRYAPSEYYYFQDKPVVGLCTAMGKSARVKIAVRNKMIRGIVQTTAHEYMHCIQFIQRGINVNSRNRAKLEREAKAFAEDILIKLWQEKGIFCPSTPYI